MIIVRKNIFLVMVIPNFF